MRVGVEIYNNNAKRMVCGVLVNVYVIYFSFSFLPSFLLKKYIYIQPDHALNDAGKAFALLHFLHQIKPKWLL